MRMGMGWIRLRSRAVLELHHDHHQMVRIGQISRSPRSHGLRRQLGSFDYTHVFLPKTLRFNAGP